MTGRLQDKVIIVTGGGSGIGLATVKLSLTNGAKVVVVDLDTSKADKELANEVSNGQVICVQADTTKEADVERYNKVTLDKFGKVDGVALNAGAGHPAQAWTETDVSVMDKMYEVNIKGTWLGVKHAVRAMQASPHEGKGCSIVITASVASLYGQELISPYASAKWALRGMGLCAAQEFGPIGIRTNVIQPGATKTKLYDDIFPEQVQTAIENANVLKRTARPEEIAPLIVFLLSDEASFICGSTMAAHAAMTPT